jgi:hypothetical protein
MSFLQTLVITVFALFTLTPVFAVTPGFPYGSQKVRGVNLGGWLVLEVKFLRYLFSAPVLMHGRLALDHAFFVR